MNKLKVIKKGVILIKGKKGDSGLTPTKDELQSLIKPLIPEPKKGDKGDSYVLNIKDKKEIAKSIKVPIVEKVIEKTEVIREQPIVTNEIKEVAIYEPAEQIVDKLNPLKNVLDFQILKNIPDFALSRDVSHGGGGGSPAIVFQDEGTTITQNPILKLNVVGSGGSIVYSGSGLATLNLTGGGSTWGSITGTLSDQTDLQSALDLKAPLASPTFTGTVTTTLLVITAGTLASTVNALAVTATLSTANAAQTAVNLSITGAGSGASATQTGINLTFNAGYTGSAQTQSFATTNLNAGTGNDFVAGSYNVGVFGQARGTTTGDNVGLQGLARGGDINIGQNGRAIIAKNGATNIGVVGVALNTGTTPVQIGGYFGLQATKPTFGASAALMADNGATTSDIFVARDNGTPIFTIADGGVAYALSGVAVKNNTLDGASLMVSDGNRTLSGFAQSSLFKILGSANTYQNLIHMDNNQTGGRAGFTMSNSSSGAWENNALYLVNNGSAFGNNFYIPTYPGKSTDAGWSMLVTQGSQVTGLAIVNYSGGNIVFGIQNFPAWEIRNDGMLISVVDNSLDIGLSGAQRPRTIYAGTSVITPAITTTGVTQLSTGDSGVTVGSGTPIATYYDLQVLGGRVGTAIFRRNGSTADFTQVDFDQPASSIFSGSGFSMVACGSTFTTAFPFIQDGGTIVANSALSGGLTIGASHASASLQFFAGGSASANLTIASTGITTFAQGVIFSATARLKGYTVATLPAGTVGDIAYVTDALAPAFLTIIVGGGAVVTPVFYNGANWIGY